MDEECIQMVVDYYQSKDTPHLLILYDMSDHSAEAYDDHGAAPSWWFELRVGGVGIRKSATQGRCVRRFYLS
jgi:hypothetical protein